MHFKRFIIILTAVAVGILLYGHLSGSHVTYTGYIRLLPKSERSSPYIAFFPDSRSESYMVLARDPAFYSKLEAMTGKRVKITARLFHNEPADFDKIEILELNLLP